MSQDQEHFALEWIKDDLFETLDTARAALEEFNDSKDDETRLRTCLTSLHQVHGTLVMLELNGVGHLAEHLEKLAQALMNGTVVVADAPIQSLMQGILELPGYLDEIQKGLSDSDQPFIPLINEIRGYLSLEAMAVPPRNPLDGITTEESVQRFERIDGLGKARKVRSAYQQVLLAVLKGEDRERAVVTLGKVGQGLRRICEGTPHEAQWQAFGEFVASLGKQTGPLETNAIKLLRRTDAEIRALATEGVVALRRPVNRSLVQLLLDQAEQREHQSPTLSMLRSALDSDTKVDGLVISGRQALASAALALRDDLTVIKDQIDVDVRAEAVTRDSLNALLDPLRRMASTLSLLGFQSSHTSVQDQIETVKDCLITGEFDLQTLQDVAASLLQVDEHLAGATAGSRGLGEVERITSEAHRAVAQEARAGLEEVKQAIVAYVSSSWSYSELEQTPAILDSVCGALDMVPLARPARQLDDCRSLILNDLVHRAPSWEALDHLADAISGVDYYLERLIEDSAANVENILDMVDRSLAEFHEAIVLGDTATGTADSLADAVAADELTPAEELDDRDGAEAQELAAESAEVAEAELSEPVDVVDVGAPAAGATLFAPRSVPALTVSDSFDEDDEIAEIFVEEASEVLAEIDVQLPLLQADLQDAEALGTLRRNFHTLKGSGRMVGANTLGELAWTVEQALNKLMEESAPATPGILEAATLARAAVPDLVARFEARQPADPAPVAELIARIEALASGAAVDDLDIAGEAADDTAAETGGPLIAQLPYNEQLDAETLEALAEQDLLPPVTAENFVDLDALSMVEPDVAVPEITEDLSEAFTEDDALAYADEDDDEESQLDESLLIFIDEAREHVQTLRAQLFNGPFEPDEEVLRALHTLAGSASIAGVEALAQVTRPAYELGRAMRTQRAVSEATVESVNAFMHQLVDALAADIETVESGASVSPRPTLAALAEQLLDELDQRNEAHQLLSIDGLSVLFDAGEYLRNWHAGSQDLAFSDSLKGTLERLDERADSLDQDDLSNLAGELLQVHAGYSDLELPDDAFALLDRAHDELLKFLDAVVAEQTPDSLTELIGALAELRAEPEATDAELIDEVEPVSLPAAPVNEDTGGTDAGTPSGSGLEAEAVSETDKDAPAEPADAAPYVGQLFGRQSPESMVVFGDLSEDPASEQVNEEHDPEIIAIFVEEAEEILESFEESVAALRRERDNQLHIENLLRGLHTLKGGARLSGLTALGDATHQLESQIVERQSQSIELADDDFMSLLQVQFDQLVAQVAVAERWVKAPGNGSPDATAATARDAQLGAPDADTDTDTAEETALATEESAVVSLLSATAANSELGAARDARDGRDNSARPVFERAPQEVVRVGAGVLEELVNLAGESSILRARVEQGLGDFTGALDEMETTIGRVREQLRRLEIETEAQILFRQERVVSPSHEDFDPLEMDRYSQLQQLSRALTESASDMLDLKETLLYKARESETLLLQQARINTELQEGLMRTRMVPFSRLLPRLRRIVRQVSTELGKDVEFHAYNAEGELDRSLLERMIPPLEHMLRNAVDHGIESAEERSSYGKTDRGQIELRLAREGGDVLIEISDDGHGIDVESVRAKALERGLLEPGVELRDDEVIQFILAPGFTTAKSVTQISGRGVGMDVVHSEVKQLGGTVSVASVPGKGTRIALRIPFTVSVNRALMVSVADELYAIPLNTIEGIVLLGPQELEKLYASDSKSFEYAGISYQVRYLGQYLGREYRGNPNRSSSPVVLVRAGDQSVAIHVDAVQGSREIVVKSLGPQFAGVGGISGATILGDGSVVVILDLLALIRMRSHESQATGRRTLAHSRRTRCVMVVDDSVTVRKVTSRLLERQGMDVLVAKDGVEAVAMLQERRPDIMLLDIEMPRMDGFEVARQIRRDDQLNGLPIVMISSRTGDKHQERAVELGVNRFLGKPFQESELLETIDDLVQS